MSDVRFPEPKHDPAGVLQGRLLRRIASHVAADLDVPVSGELVGPPFRGMPVPEQTVDEDANPPAGERYVDSAAWCGVMDAVAQETREPERASKRKLGFRILASDARHDARAWGSYV